ncbi:hypothetical protein Trydic_g23798 [Trypoxylus dichotomus]
MMRIIKMTTLRMIAGKKMRDGIRKDIIEEYRIENVVRFAREGITQWNNHVQRAEKPRLIRIARGQRPMERRDSGKPMRT